MRSVLTGQIGPGEPAVRRRVSRNRRRSAMKNIGVFELLDRKPACLRESTPKMVQKTAAHPNSNELS